jgi:hypothetical protein
MKLFLMLLFFCLSFSSFADELKLHVIKSPVGINWSTPWKLAITTVKNQIAPVGNKRAYSISHVFVEVNCPSVNTRILRGMTSATNTEERDIIFKKKYGLGAMFHTYVGKLEKDQEIEEDLLPYKGAHRKAELTFKVSPLACQRMLDYAEEYEQLGYGQMYSGLQADPLKGEGAGCSAFAVSFMRVAGLMDDFTSDWKQKINIPKKLIGGPLTGNRVKFSFLLLNPFLRWSSDIPHIHLEAWDPELMHQWIHKTYFEIRNGRYESDFPVSISNDQDTLKLEINMENRETPIGSFWIPNV